MIQRLLARYFAVAFILPFCLLGICVVAVALAYTLGLGPNDKSLAFLVLFLLFVPVGIYGFGILGEALFLHVLRITGLTPWFERHCPDVPNPRHQRAQAWLDKLRQRWARRNGC
jgi:hypothetical protein